MDVFNDALDPLDIEVDGVSRVSGLPKLKHSQMMVSPGSKLRIRDDNAYIDIVIPAAPTSNIRVSGDSSGLFWARQKDH